MRNYHRILLPALVLYSLGAFAGTPFKATTTLTAETANNTSAANSFLTQSNGNLGAGNISKAPISSLLYSGSTAKTYVHVMPWFGFPDHMNVGYSSSDAAQVQKQVTDMVGRGLDGAIIDWFGQGTLNHEFATYSQVVQQFMQQAEQQTGFHFAIMDDAGSLKACASTTGCDLIQTLINDLTYAYNTWETSAAYLHYNNQPVVYFFGQEAYTLDWTRVRASVPGNPFFIFRNTGGFSAVQSNGGFSWVAPETVSTSDPMALAYLDDFDRTALSLLPEYSTESGYKGFNDKLASWGTGRLIQQQCGQTWLASVAESGKFYSASQQMLGIQIVTWNDYEEGTEIESGIDNCVTISAAVQGAVASWTITGQANTVDHYTIFLSQDGENLMWLADVSASTTSLGVAPFHINSGSYTVFVKAVGKPSLANTMSAGASLVIPNQPPTAVLTISPGSGVAPLAVIASTIGSVDPDGSIASSIINFGDGSAGVNAASATHTYSTAGSYTITATITDNLGSSSSKSATISVAAQPFVFSGSTNSATISAGQTATYNLSLETQNSGFTGTVAVACNGAPAGTSCSVSPSSVSFTGSTASAPLTVTVSTTQQARIMPTPARFLKGLPLAFAAIIGLFAGKKKKKLIALAGATVFLVFGLGLIGCAGGASSANVTQPAPPRASTNATLTINGASGGQTASTTLTLTITH